MTARRIEYAQITYGENPSMLWEIYVDGVPVGPELATQENAEMVAEWLREAFELEAKVVEAHAKAYVKAHIVRWLDEKSDEPGF